MPKSAPTTQLTEREVEVLRLFEQGHSNREIAGRLYLTVGTVKWYAQQIYNKLGVSNRQDAVETARTLGMLTADDVTELLSDVPNNLPAEISSFVGREDEINRLLLMLADVRLLTLTGTGGTGKTRLALRVATAAMRDYPDGVYFIELAHLRDSDKVVIELARTLNLRDVATDSIHSVIQRTLSDMRCLLLIDNFEHVIEAAPLLTDLLSSAPHLRIIVTSREALNLSGEQQFLVPPLHLPSNDDDLAHCQENEAIKLFSQRAQAARSDFMLTESNIEDVVTICQRLDALPLALELAASRIRLFSPKDMVKQLEQPIELLTSGPRDTAQRHRTLYHAIDWSYNLLRADEKQLFAHMSIFADGASFEAVSTICHDLSPIEQINTLNSLVDKSLLQQYDDTEGETRFRLLRTIRDYAQEKLANSDNLTSLRERFADYFLHLVHIDNENAQQHHRWLTRMQLEQQNLRNVFDWFIEQARWQDAITMANALFWHWIRQSPKEGLRRIDTILSAAPDEALTNSELLYYATHLAMDTGAFDKGQVYAGYLKAIAEATQNQREWGRVWTFDAFLNQEEGLGYITQRLEAALTCFETANDSMGIGWVKGGLGVVAMVQDRHDVANDLFLESYERVYQDRNYLYAAGALLNLGLNNIQRGELETARHQLRDAIMLDQQVGTYNGIANAVIGLAGIAHLRKDWLETLRLLAIVDSILKRFGVILDYPERDYYDQYRQDCEQHLSVDDHQKIYESVHAQPIDTLLRIDFIMRD